MATLNDGPSRGRSREPRNITQITHAAQSYHYSAMVGLKYWLRTATALLKEADIYEREGDDEQTYLLLFRHAHLILTNLAVHPEAKDKSLKPTLLQAQAEVNKNLKKLDVLKPRINKHYERQLEIDREREAHKTEALRERIRSQDVPSEDHEVAYSHESTVRQLHAHENQAFAVQLAHKEISRRARESKPGGHPDIDGGSIARAVQRSSASVSAFKYPTVPGGRRSFDAPAPPLPAKELTGPPSATLSPPVIPAKPLPAPAYSALPPRPSKVLEGAHQDLVQPAPKEQAFTFAPTAYLENGNLLRTLFLPPTLRTTFLRLAYKNTQSNLETCAFIAGTLIANALFVSKLIVPAQISTSDTCEMTNEAQLFDYIDAEADLMVLGWIHTHPTQSCFMSSRDLHTHSGYQMMLAESVAIVCAPSKGDTSHGGEWGVYRLTDPPGKNTILSCQKPGIFHPHDVDNIYTDALKPGHVVEAKGLEFEVVDLRV